MLIFFKLLLLFFYFPKISFDSFYLFTFFISLVSCPILFDPLFLGASFPAFCIRLLVNNEDLPPPGWPDALLPQPVVSPRHPPHHSLCMACPRTAFCRRHHGFATVAFSSSYRFVVCFFCGSCRVHELRHASRTVTVPNPTHLFSFCLETIKKETIQTHARVFHAFPCFPSSVLTPLVIVLFRACAPSLIW